MKCPQCDNGEVDSAGRCAECGHVLSPRDQAAAAETAFEKTVGESGDAVLEEPTPPAVSAIITVDYSEEAIGHQDEDAIPSWKAELSKRLQEIKQKKQRAEQNGSSPKADVTLSLPSRLQPIPPPLVVPPARVVEKPGGQRAPKKPSPPLQKKLQPLEPGLSDGKAVAGAEDPERVQKLIDNIMLRQAIEEDGSKLIVTPPDHRGLRESPDHEGKLILLSRTLSGLVDLICVVLLTGIFIISADFFSGILFLDSVSIIYFSALLLLTYFAYSLFFLATSYQTLGMMITDLRVIGTDERHPSFRSLLGRSVLYLVSLLVIGAGLIWSLFDEQNRCLHDRLSGTRVVRM